MLLSRPPLWCSGVLCSEDGFAFSLLLLESLSLMMSYCRQNSAMTAAGRGDRNYSVHNTPMDECTHTVTDTYCTFIHSIPMHTCCICRCQACALRHEHLPHTHTHAHAHTHLDVPLVVCYSSPHCLSTLHSNPHLINDIPEMLGSLQVPSWNTQLTLTGEHKCELIHKVISMQTEC